MDDILALCVDVPVREFAPGEELMVEGAHSGRIFVLIDGVVGIESGGVLIKRVAEAGAFLGEISALLGINHSARVVALEPTRVHQMAANTITSSPALLLGVAQLLAARLHAITGYLVDVQTQYVDSEGHLSLMAEVLSELTAARPVTISPGSTRDGYEH